MCDFSHIEQIAVLDDEILTVLRSLERPGDSISFLNDLIDTFIRETPGTIRTLMEAVRRQNLRASLHAAHQLKGLSGNIGVTRLAGLAEWVELELEKSRFPDPQLLQAKFEDLLQDAIVKLTQSWKR